jgi:hypothetical protein
MDRNAFEGQSPQLQTLARSLVITVPGNEGKELRQER